MAINLPVDLRPIEVQREAMGHSTPYPEEKLLLWSMVTMPQTGISKETGGYQPFGIMRNAHFHPARTKLPAGGIRGSKSVGLSMEALSWFPHSDLLWLAGESYEDSRQEFEYVMEAAIHLGWTDNSLITFSTVKSLSCSLETYWGALLETKSLQDDANSLMSRAPDFVGICEPGKTTVRSYRRAKERTATKRGLLWMAGTFEQSADWMEDCWRAWRRWPNEDNAKAFTIPSWVNRVIFPKGLQDPEIAALRRSCEDFDEFLRRVVGVPANQPDMIMSGAWAPKKHVGLVEYKRWNNDKSLMEPVYLAIDPGYSGESRYVVLAIQIIGNQIRIIDEVVGRGKTHEQVIAECMMRPWWPVANAGTIDPRAGNSHIFGSTSPQDIWARKENGGIKLQLPQRKDLEDLIRILKSHLIGAAGYQVVVDGRCERLRIEMDRWRRMRTNMGMGKPIVAYCDAIKALGYFLTHLDNGEVGRDPASEMRVEDYSRPRYTANQRDPVYDLEETMQLQLNRGGEWMGSTREYFNG